MICAHIVTLPVPANLCGESYQYTVLPDGRAFLVHADCHTCNDPQTRLPHPLHRDPLDADTVAALSSFGVVRGDKMRDALLKVGATWPAAYP